MGQAAQVAIKAIQYLLAGWVSSDMYNEYQKGKQASNPDEPFSITSMFTLSNIIKVGAVVGIAVLISKFIKTK